MRLSIVIPVYNEERFIGPCLDAILGQNERVHEIIVVDNNCTDGTRRILDSYADRIQVLMEQRQGVQYARNTGFDAATGDVIGRIDADTRLPPDWSRCVREEFADPSIDAVTGSVRYYDVRLAPLLGWVDTLFRRAWSRRRIDWLFGANMAIRADGWCRVRESLCARPDVHEDIDRGIHLYGAGGRIAFVPGLRVFTSARRIANRFRDFRRYALMGERSYRMHRDVASPCAYPRSWLTARLHLGLHPVLRLLYALAQADPWATLRRDDGRKNPMQPIR
ncbi:glycosyl transferase [Paractinoplanes toevensis]|uniref:Glycosyl transferase n=1 Tax=Paractinoplanes toevensis TaxID=571911 RepID=A0A919W8B7_9ACTN|nr:glycosyl transferase [Actinoplanes toevensis]